MLTTWNPSDKYSDVVLSNGNLTARGAGGHWSGVRSTTSHSTGKHCFSYIGGMGGVALSSATLYNTYNSTDAEQIYTDGTYMGLTGGTSGVTYTSSDTITVAVDCDNHLVSFYKNGTLMGSAVTCPTGALFALVCDADYGTTGDFIPSFIPSGYLSWDAIPPLSVMSFL